MDPSLNPDTYVRRREDNSFISSPTSILSLHRSRNRRFGGSENSFISNDFNRNKAEGDFYPRYHFHSAASFITEPSVESVGRRRHLMESKGALNLPPVCTTLCITFVALYIFKEELHVFKEDDVCVSWKHVWKDKEYWRLVTAQFFHFNRLQLLVNCFTLFTVGRYLERKVTKMAMIIVIIVMSAVSNSLYTVVNPFLCQTPQSQNVVGFGNIIHSLRVLLAYALEPRNYERDLVFGLYPMVVSASHAPWQPILDLIIFKIVLPEQCITGQLSGILAGFLVTGVLLLWPAKGVYIASPPYYWTFMGSAEPPDDRPSRESDEDEEDAWRMQAYTNSDFWLPSSSNGLGSLSTASFSTISSTHVDLNDINRAAPLPSTNSLHRRAERMKKTVADFFSHPTLSLANLLEPFQPKGEDESKKLEKMEAYAEISEIVVMHRKRKSMLLRKATSNSSNTTTTTTTKVGGVLTPTPAASSTGTEEKHRRSRKQRNFNLKLRHNRTRTRFSSGEDENERENSNSSLSTVTEYHNHNHMFLPKTELVQ